MTQVADPAQQQAPAGDQTAPADKPTGNQLPADKPAEPYMVFTTKDEFESRFGPTRQQGRLSLAKEHGYETIEAFNAAMNEYKTYQQSQQTEQERVTNENKTLAQKNKELSERVNSRALKDSMLEMADEVGFNKERLDAINDLRQKAEGEIDADGNVVPELVKHSITQVLQKYPEFAAKTVTIGATGTPAHAAGETSTVDEQIKAAEQKGDMQTVIALQLQKFNTPS